jgi:uncharacterized protein
MNARGKTDAFPPVFVAPDFVQVLSHLRSTGKTFGEFRSTDLVKSADLTFVPFYRIYEEHYAVYFPVMTPDEWRRREAELNADRERRAQWEAATLDTVEPGFQQSEVEHDLKSENSETGDNQDRKWRDARNAGWFSYQMAVDPDAPIVLVSTYWGDEWQERNFDILIDGAKVATQKLHTNKPGEFFDQTYTIPPALTKGKTKVMVRFQAHNNDMAGGVFGLRTMRANAMSNH